MDCVFRTPPLILVRLITKVIQFRGFLLNYSDQNSRVQTSHCAPLCEIMGANGKFSVLEVCVHKIDSSSIPPPGVSQTIPFGQMKSLLVAPLPADFLQVLYDEMVVLSICCLL